MINNLTHISDTYSLCINLTFTSQPNLVVEPGVHPSLHPYCKYQIVFAKINLKIYYPPPYYHQIRHYQDADLIRRAKDSTGKKLMQII